MNFFRYLDVFTIHSGVSFPLIVLIHVTWMVYKLSMDICLSYIVPYMLIVIIIVSTSLDEQWSYLIETTAIDVDGPTLWSM